MTESTRFGFIAALCLCLTTAAQAQVNLLGQDSPSPESRLDALAQLPLPLALQLLSAAPDSNFVPSAAELPTLRSVIPALIHRYMGEPYAEAPLRTALAQGITRYSSGTRPGVSAPEVQDLRGWFQNCKDDLDHPAAADPAESAANQRGIQQLKEGLTAVIQADRQLSEILPRIRRLHARIRTLEAQSGSEARTELATVREEHAAQIALAEPHKLLRRRHFNDYMDRLINSFERPPLLTETSRQHIRPIIALFKLYQYQSWIEDRVSLLRAGARSELERRAARR
jgi:hypothetical protein